MIEGTVAALGGAVLVLLMLIIIRWKWTQSKKAPPPKHLEPEPIPPTAEVVHRLCPHHHVLQGFVVEQKDSLDEHLDLLTRKLAEKEGRLRLSKSKIRETQNEIENLQAIDQDVRFRYREIMDNLKTDLLANERECKKLQDQIEWVSQRRAELREEVRRGQQLYGAAAEELASNLAELQRGRAPMVTDKPPAIYSNSSLRLRKEPTLPRASVDSSRLKSPIIPIGSPMTGSSYDQHHHHFAHH